MVLNDFELAFAGLITYGNRLYGSKASVFVDKVQWDGNCGSLYMRSVLRGSIGVLERVVLTG